MSGACLCVELVAAVLAQAPLSLFACRLYAFERGCLCVAALNLPDTSWRLGLLGEEIIFGYNFFLVDTGARHRGAAHRHAHVQR